jgi:hypothetical protein
VVKVNEREIKNISKPKFSFFFLEKKIMKISKFKKRVAKRWN